MRRKQATSKRAFTMNEASSLILSQLLAEFRERKLGSNELREGYQGLSLSELKSRCMTTGIEEVDYDLALGDLEFHKFVETGPMEMYSNPLGSIFVAIGFFSKREYSHLTETGYKEAVKIVSAPQTRSKQTIAHVHISGSTFNNSPIGVGESISQAINIQGASSNEAFIAFRNEVAKQVQNDLEREHILSRLDEREASNQLPTRYEKYAMLMGAIILPSECVPHK